MVQLTAGGGKPSQMMTHDEFIETSRKLSELSERTRLLEERLKQTRAKLQVVDETFMSRIKEIRENMTSLTEEITNMRKSTEETREIIRRIALDIESTAKFSDVKVLEKYINMLDVTRLVTKDDVIRIVQDEARKAHANKKGEV